MPSSRGFAYVGTVQQWLAASLRETMVDRVARVVELAWEESEVPREGQPDDTVTAAGLAFDSNCRLYRSVPEDGRVERLLWRAHDPLAAPEHAATGVDLFREEAPGFGDFHPSTPGPGPLARPTGLAVDVDDRLFIAESARRRILVYDLWSRRLLRAATVKARPVDLALAPDGRSVWVLGRDPTCLLRVRARTEPTSEELPDGLLAPGAEPIRLATAPDGTVYVLYAGDDANDRWIAYRAGERAGWRIVEGGEEPFDLAGAGDLEVVDAETLVVARAPGQSFLRLFGEQHSWSPVRPLFARGYDGAGIVRTPDGQVGFWTPNGFREAVEARVTYAASGRVSTFRLDGGDYQMQWGRLFVDACIPPGTSVRAACVSTDDEDSAAPAIPWQRLATILDEPPGPDPGRSPRIFHLRETGRELPWARPGTGEALETYEAPIVAEPGRYLWVALELHGTTRATPQIRCLRAEHPTHDYLSRLPRTFSRDADAAAFLQRYLAMFEGMLDDLDGRSSERAALLDPRSAPEEILGWLAGFVGLVLDERWPAPVRRRLISEAACLFRFRGTVRGLERFIEIVLGSRSRVMLLEHWRVRGLGGAYLDGASTPSAGPAVVGSSYRVGGTIGAPPRANREEVRRRTADAFRTHAHRFSVVIPATLASAEVDMVRHVLDVHRPAHTTYDICTVGSGMRVGRGLHVGLLSLVGRTGGFVTAQLGSSRIGQGALVGRPVLGVRPGSSRVATTTRAG